MSPAGVALSLSSSDVTGRPAEAPPVILATACLWNEYCVTCACYLITSCKCTGALYARIGLACACWWQLALVRKKLTGTGRSTKGLWIGSTSQFKIGLEPCGTGRVEAHGKVGEGSQAALHRMSLW